MEEIKGVGEMIKQRGKVNGGEKRGEEQINGECIPGNKLL
jgi:hypothetical protein